MRFSTLRIAWKPYRWHRFRNGGWVLSTRPRGDNPALFLIGWYEGRFNLRLLWWLTTRPGPRKTTWWRRW